MHCAHKFLFSCWNANPFQTRSSTEFVQWRYWIQYHPLCKHLVDGITWPQWKRHDYVETLQLDSMWGYITVFALYFFCNYGRPLTPAFSANTLLVMSFICHDAACWCTRTVILSMTSHNVAGRMCCLPDYSMGVITALTCRHSVVGENRIGLCNNTSRKAEQCIWLCRWRNA